jgi:hypothetical protein
VNRFIPEHLARAATGVVTAGGALGQGLLPFAGRFLIEGFGWRLAFAGIGSVMLAALALSLPILRWPLGTMAPPASVADSGQAGAAEYKTVALLGLAAYLCCACMGGPLVHMASFAGSVCGSPAIGVTSLLIAMIFGAIGRVCFEWWLTGWAR